MKIAHVTCLYPPAHLGGAPLQCESIALGQHARGHEVAVFSGVLDPGGAMYATQEDVQDGIPVSYVNTVDAFSERDERNWHHPEVEPYFQAFLDRHRPQVVHFHSIQSLGASLLPLAARAGATVVVTMHDLWWICARQFCVDRSWHPCVPAVTPGSCACERGTEELWRRNGYLKECLAHCDLVLSPSSALIERIRWSGIEGRMAVDPNGVSSEIVHAERPPHGGPARIVFAGGSNNMKGVQVLIPALRLLSERGVEYSASIYGVDPFAIRTTAALRGLPARSLKSFRPEQLDRVLAETDVLVLPSVMFESSSRVVREALLRGVPVIATESGGPEEVIEHGVNGLLVATDRPLALADALQRLIEDPELQNRMRGAGPLGAVPSPAAQVEHLERLYAEVMEAPSKAASRARPAVARVLFLAGIEGAPLRYRVHHAMEQLRLRGISSGLRHYSDPRARRDLDGADAVIIYRSPATRELLALIREARRRGLPVIFDVDDLIFDPELAEQLPSLAGLSPDAKRLWVDGVRRYRATLEECGRGLGSTPEIVRRMVELGIDARVHPNGSGTTLAVASEAARRARREQTAPGFRVGYFSGTDTHDVDLNHIAAALAGFRRAHPDAELVLGGHLLPHPLLGEVTRLPFAPWHLHPARLAALDLNLAPLIAGPFNEAKSSIKWSEAALVEVPTLASASQPFRESIVSGSTGLLASDAKEWSEQLEFAYADRDRLRRIGRKARLAAYGQGSPWILGARLVESLEHFLGAQLPERDQGGGNWPNEAQITALEPPDLFPGLVSSGARSAPGDSIGGRPITFPMPNHAGPLKRLDVQVATYGRQPRHPLRLRLVGSSGRPEREVLVAPEDVGDNGWVAFELKEAWVSDDPGLAEVATEPGSEVSVWITAAGKVAARSFHLPPVPPDIPELATLASATQRPIPIGDRLRTLAGFGRIVVRQAVYIVRTEGPARGSRRLAGAVRRRVLEQLILRFRGGK